MTILIPVCHSPDDFRRPSLLLLFTRDRARPRLRLSKEKGDSGDEDISRAMAKSSNLFGHKTCSGFSCHSLAFNLSRVKADLGTVWWHGPTQALTPKYHPDATKSSSAHAHDLRPRAAAVTRPASAATVTHAHSDRIAIAPTMDMYINQQTLDNTS